MSDTKNPHPPDADYDAFDEITYGSIVWGQFQKNRIAHTGLWAILGLILIAVYAPLVVLDYPFVITYMNEAGQQTTEYPWFSRLLFDRNLFENSIDVFFNLLLLLSPLMIASGVAARALFKKLRARVRARRWQQLLGAWAAVIVALMVFLTVFESSQPYANYTQMATNSRVDAEVEVIGLAWKAGGAPDAAAVARAREDVVSAIFPPVAQSFRDANLAEVERGFSTRHLFGTDNRGRDVFARMVYGTRISLTIGFIAVSIYIFIGVILGALAGYFRGWVDALVLRMIEVMLCFPSFILILTLVAFVEKPSIFHVMLIIGLTSWTGPARLVRAEFLKLGTQDFVAAAIASGISQSRVIFRHVLPNALSPVLVNATFGVASAILVESSLAFLGVGDPSAASWGEILNIGKQLSSLRMILIPGMAIFVTVSLFNLVGEGARDALDPKLRK